MDPKYWGYNAKCRYCGATYRVVVWLCNVDACDKPKCRKTAKIVKALTYGTRRVYTAGGIDQMLVDNETDFSGRITNESLDRVFRPS